VHDDVAMDVTLNDDGTLQEVKVIEGQPVAQQRSDAAIDAVKPWRHQPLTVQRQVEE
jgi:hypothetical protein